MKRKSVSYKNKFGIGEAITLIILIILVVSILYPIFWIVVSSFKDYKGIYRDIWGFPEEYHFSNYSRAWSRGIADYFKNSVIVTSCTLVGVLALTTTLAFGICQLKGKLSTVVFFIVMGCLLLSPQVCVLPLFIFLRHFKLTDTYLCMILPYIAFRIPLSVMLIHASFISIPKHLEEAAIIDGASIFQIFRKVYLALSKPILSTIFIMTIYYAWNEFMFATILVDSSHIRTIPVGLMVFRDSLMTDWGVVMAGMVISCFPIVMMFIVLQRNFIRGMTSGAVKG